jgi:CTP synthase
VEIVELRDHPWFVASQFHPEFKSRPDRPHPLFEGFVHAAVQQVGQPVPEPAAADVAAGPVGA